MSDEQPPFYDGDAPWREVAKQLNQENDDNLTASVLAMAYLLGSANFRESIAKAANAAVTSPKNAKLVFDNVAKHFHLDVETNVKS